MDSFVSQVACTRGITLIDMQEIARDIALVDMTMSNAYLVGNKDSWVLVDSGTPGNAEKIKQAAEAYFGAGKKPRAIILTHGHGDHSGSAGPLAEEWGVRVYAHRLEWPYLDGRSAYPPMDPTAPGFFSFLTRFFPKHSLNLQPHLVELANNLPQLGMQDWQVVNTPGHTPGHVVLFRASDGVLLSGDAVITMDVDSIIATFTKRKQLSRPPAPATTDWPEAGRSMHVMAALRPRLIASGHGVPMSDVADRLQELADHFPVPEHGRYVREAARADENGVTYVPPAPPDMLPKIVGGVAAGALAAGVGALILRKRRD